eukprot:CAMPEP_0118852684 /NCGR_PEP_ID=MMETSP1163-20130328/1584_1 /TAXON_ID=124430 /ORGANISM="Phaeomonas parva, Strain CCMP2877" /LENGTH=286 /DNA_ID=CAMNT_0006785141 /DNA_START=215 /DNA_END=1076 /DNA_ORIENTATION=-
MMGASGKAALAEHLEHAELHQVKNRGLAARGLGGLEGALREHAPDLVHIHRRAELAVLHLVELAHTHLTEVTRVILIEENAVVVLATGVTAATRVAAVLADTAMAGGHVAALLAVLVKTGRLGGWEIGLAMRARFRGMDWAAPASLAMAATLRPTAATATPQSISSPPKTRVPSQWEPRKDQPPRLKRCMRASLQSSYANPANCATTQLAGPPPQQQARSVGPWHDRPSRPKRQDDEGLPASVFQDDPSAGIAASQSRNARIAATRLACASRRAGRLARAAPSRGG